MGDIALAVALAVVGGAAAAHVAVPGDGWAFAMVVLTALVLVVRRRWPLVTLAAATVLTSAYLILGYPYGPILFSFLVAVYTVACHLPLSRSAPASLAALAILLTHLLTNRTPLPGFLGLVPASAWVAVPFAIGVTVRLSRESIARARAEALRQHMYDERLRVAREVHDVVGHGLAAIKMQADVALHVLPRKPEQAEIALTAISRTSSKALDELRATLALLRRPGSDSRRSPVPGLARLEDLRQRMGDAGVEVHLDTTGSPRALPAAVDLAGYRVVQESLTNVLRHGEAKLASVRVGYDTDAIVIAVSNPVSHVSSRGDGLGIPGMQERVTSLGGEFTAGPTPDGRFEVRATLPTGGHQ
jgi:signal transduction histidine kinase